jgi:hypothetical protein
VNSGEDLPLAAARLALQDIHQKHTLHQLRPPVVARVRSGLLRVRCVGSGLVLNSRGRRWQGVGNSSRGDDPGSVSGWRAPARVRSSRCGPASPGSNARDEIPARLFREAGGVGDPEPLGVLDDDQRRIGSIGGSTCRPPAPGRGIRYLAGLPRSRVTARPIIR